MPVSGIGGAGGFGLEKAAGAAGRADAGFGDLFESAMTQLEKTQADASAAVEALATGGDVDLHDVIVATQMEAISFQLALQVRNRFVETVQTVMNMQV